MTGSSWGSGADVMERESSLDGGPLSSAAPSSAKRSLSRKRARKPDAPRDAISVGIRVARNRPGSCAAEQVRAAPRVRNHARRRAFRLSLRVSASRADHHARDRRRPADLAHDAGARGQLSRGQLRAGGKRRPLRGGRRDGDQFHREPPHRGGNRGRLSAPGLRDPQDFQARLCRSPDRARRRGA